MSGQDFRRVSRADVYKNGVHAATLQRTAEDTITFAYLPEYRGPAVATSLGLQVGKVVTVAGALPAFFQGLLPEGRRLTLLSRALKASLDDEFTLLLAIGQDLPGDVQVVPTGQPLQAAQAGAMIADTQQQPVDFGELVAKVDEVGVAGVQNKISASRLTMAQADGILKLGEPDFPLLVENEDYHLAAARRPRTGLNIPVANSRLLQDATGAKALWVQRFDREGTKRFALEDAAQVLQISPAQKYSQDSETVLAALSKHCRAPLLAARNLYVQLAFAWLSGNGDVHAKNLSILADQAGQFQVAPVYDVPCTVVYGDNSMALPIAGRVKNIRARHWESLAADVSLPLPVARTAMATALRAVADVQLAEVGFAGSTLYGAERELSFRRLEAQRFVG